MMTMMKERRRMTMANHRRNGECVIVIGVEGNQQFFYSDIL
jgi:hypothetical protein